LLPAEPELPIWLTTLGNLATLPHRIFAPRNHQKLPVFSNFWISHRFGGSAAPTRFQRAPFQSFRIIHEPRGCSLFAMVSRFLDYPYRPQNIQNLEFSWRLHGCAYGIHWSAPSKRCLRPEPFRLLSLPSVRPCRSLHRLRSQIWFPELPVPVSMFTFRHSSFVPASANDLRRHLRVDKPYVCIDRRGLPRPNFAIPAPAVTRLFRSHTQWFALASPAASGAGRRTCNMDCQLSSALPALPPNDAIVSLRRPCLTPLLPPAAPAPSPT
jgi:hypothetical protein